MQRRKNWLHEKEGKKGRKKATKREGKKNKVIEVMQEGKETEVNS